VGTGDVAARPGSLEQLRREVRAVEGTAGRHHPSTARALAELAVAARAAGQVDEAELSGRRALAILQTQPVPDRRALAQVLGELGELFAATGRRADADHARRRAAELQGPGA
jgi:hypothetical protein